MIPHIVCTVFGSLLGGIGAAVSPFAIEFGLAAGAVFGLVLSASVHGRATTLGEGLAFGVAYSFLAWMALPSWLFAASEGTTPFCLLDSCRAEITKLVAFLLLLGVPLGLSAGLLHRRPQGSAKLDLPRALITGAASGLFAAAFSEAWSSLEGLGAGLVFSLLFSRDVRSLGQSLGLGFCFGILLWLGLSLTLVPLLDGGEVLWNLEAARSQFSGFVADGVFGILLGVFASLTNRVWQALLIDSDPLHRELEGLGTRATRSILSSGAAGFSGGLVYALLLFDTDAFFEIAGLLNSESALVGIILHLVLSIGIGITYAALFPSDATHAGTAVSSGLVFGLVWWWVGDLSLFHHLSGHDAPMTATAVADHFPEMIGHLVFGVTTAVVYFYLHRRFGRTAALDPRFQVRAARLAGPRSAAPCALWVFALGAGVLIPVLLA